MKAWWRWPAAFSGYQCETSTGPRTILALSKNTGKKFRTFTFKHNKLDKADSTVPLQLSRILELEHSFWEPTEVDSNKRRNDLLEAADGAIINGDHTYVYGTGENVFNAYDSILMGTGFEVGRCYYWKKLKPDKPTSYNDIIPPLEQRERSDIWHEAVEVYIKTLDEEFPLDIDWRDRFYIEQRMGSFGAGHHFYHELEKLNRIDIANSLWIMKLMLDYSIEDRKKGVSQIEIIKSIAPELLSIPINPKDPENPLMSFARKRIPESAKVRIKKILKR